MTINSVDHLKKYDEREVCSIFIEDLFPMSPNAGLFHHLLHQSVQVVAGHILSGVGIGVALVFLYAYTIVDVYCVRLS